MSLAVAYEDISSMDQINLDDYSNIEQFPYNKQIIRTSGILEKKIYIYREKETQSVITSNMYKRELELYGAEGGTPKYLSVFVNAAGDIYLSDKTYNKYSFRLISALGREADIVNEQIIPGHYSIRDFSDVIDISLCRLPNRAAFFTGDGKIAYKSVVPDEKTLIAQSRRDSIMSNRKIKYIYSTDDSLVHDKSCEKANFISNASFMGSEDMPEGRTFCEKCYLNFLIRQGCVDDFKKANLYRKFFKDGKLRTKDVEKLIAECKARIHMDEADILQVSCNEDSWIIKKEPDQYKLFHNSYIILDDNNRYIRKSPSYHIQGTYHKLSRALWEIEEYSWEGHLAHKAEVEKAKALELKRENSFFNRFRRWLRKLFSNIK